MEITYLAIDQIIPPPKSDSNRLVGIESLALNIKAVQQAVPDSTGILNALVVRIHQGADSSRTKYEIVAGRRRYAAALKLKLEKVPVTIVSTSDDNAQAITVAENFQRVPLTPLEEATAIAKMCELGQTNDEIAANLGQSVAFVVRRSKLIELSPEWKKELVKPDGRLTGYTAAMLELIARYPVHRQDAMLKTIDPQYLPTLKEMIEDFAREDSLLGNAAFSLTDETLLPKAGACVNCPKRASAQPLLFSDEADSNVPIKKDRCIDPKCWNDKFKAHQAQKFAAMKKEHPDAILVSSQRSYQIREDKLPAGVLNADQFSQCGKKVEGAKPAILIDGPNRGQLIHITEDKHNAGSGARAARTTSTEPKKPITDKERAQRLRDRRNAWIVNHIKETLLSDLPNGLIQAKSINHHAIMAIVAVFGVSRNRDYKNGNFRYLSGIRDEWKAIPETRALSMDKLTLAVWLDLARDMKKRVFAQNGEHASKLVKDLAPLLEILGVTYEDLWKLAAAEIPDKHNFLGENPDPKTIPVMRPSHKVGHSPKPDKTAKPKKVTAGKSKKAKPSKKAKK